MAQRAGGGRWGRNVKGKEALAGVQGGAVSKQRLEDQETQEGRRGVEGPSQVRWEARSDAESIEEAPAGSKVLLGNAVTSGSGWRTGVRGNHPGGWGAGPAGICLVPTHACSRPLKLSSTLASSVARPPRSWGPACWRLLARGKYSG